MLTRTDWLNAVSDFVWDFCGFGAGREAGGHAAAQRLAHAPTPGEGAHKMVVKAELKGCFMMQRGKG